MNNIDYAFAEQTSLPSPQLVYYPSIIRENIQRMIRIAGDPHRLWPHMKTYKMREIVAMLLDAGIDHIKCATIAEAEMASQVCSGDGRRVKHILVAYPMVGPNSDRFLQLIQTFPGVRFYTIGDDTETVRRLGEKACAMGETVQLFMDVDLGQHRSGVPMMKVTERYTEWASFAGIHLCGLHAYDGHRHEKEIEAREREVEKSDAALDRIRFTLEAKGIPCAWIVAGGTPSFPAHAKHQKQYFLSPGTCVIQDAGYRDAYPDLPFIPSAAVLVRVISRPSTDTMTLDLGVKAVASDPIGERAEIVGMEYAKTILQNEEHWVVQVPFEHLREIPPIGTEMFAIPVHVCPTTALYPEVAVVEDGHLTGWWEVAARNRKLTI